MFKNPFKKKNETPNPEPKENSFDQQSTVPLEQPILKKDVSPEALRELLEKNLKWSQIIYEQNRKINSKLFWSAVVGWLRFAIILLPFIFALWFLPPFIKNFKNIYDQLFTTTTPRTNTSTSIQEIINILPLNAEQQQQLKALLTN